LNDHAIVMAASVAIAGDARHGAARRREQHRYGRYQYPREMVRSILHHIS
jgi:hypothetical protein